MTKMKLDRDRVSRIRLHVKDNPRDSFAAVARHFNTNVKEIEKALRPKGSRPELPACEHLFCNRAGTFGFNAFRNTRGTYYCQEHKEQGNAESETPRDHL